MVTSFWKNYDAKSAYDGYLTEDNKLRKHARIMSGILERHGKKKLQEIEKNCQSTISARGINFRVYAANNRACLLYTSPSPRDRSLSRMPSSA